MLSGVWSTDPIHLFRLWKLTVYQIDIHKFFRKPMKVLFRMIIEPNHKFLPLYENFYFTS